MKGSKKIVFFHLTSSVITVILLYLLLPSILNYPPFSVDTDFQKAIDGVTYTPQFILISIFCLSISIIMLFKNINQINRLNSKIEKDPAHRQAFLNKLTSVCLKTPIILYATQIMLPLIFTPILLLIVSKKLIVSLKISISFALFFSLSSAITYALSQSEFKKMIKNIYLKYPEYKNNILNTRPKIGAKSQLLIELVPLIIVALFFTSFLAYTLNSKLNGNTLYQFYDSEISAAFSSKSYDSESELLEDLKNLKINGEIIDKFIIRNDGSYSTINNTELSDFFVQYSLTYKDSSNRGYDYYCIDNQGTFTEISLENGETYLVGIIYSTSSETFLVSLFISFVVLLFLILFTLYYIANTLAKDIKIITDGLNNIIDENSLNTKLISVSNDEFGVLSDSYNKIVDLTSQHLTEIQNNQDILVEQERLASLGQMVGGIAHNLKTPIFSIAGGLEGLTDLINEYDASIENELVTNEDMHAIARDMNEWIVKLKDYVAYMSDVITAVKGQTVALSDTESASFSINELFKRVDILMKHEIKNALATLEIKNTVPDNSMLYGNVNSLVQILNNMISNALDAYSTGNYPEKKVELTAEQSENKIILSVKDYGPGISKIAQEKLFKKMVTTKGKNGTGLGMFMSYSNIRAHFNGDMSYTTEEGKGTTFFITLPIKQNNIF